MIGKCATANHEPIRMALTREEACAETIYRLMPRLSRDEFCTRMKNLGDHQEGRIAQAYACFLLIRRMPPSKEKAWHWEEMTDRLREALNVQSLTIENAGRRTQESDSLQGICEEDIRISDLGSSSSR